MEYCVIIAKLTLLGNPTILVSFILLIIIDIVNHTTSTALCQFCNIWHCFLLSPVFW